MTFDSPHRPSTVLFLTGPSGAGKTSAALNWAASRARPCACISHDQVRAQIRGGFADPSRCWDAAAQAQWNLARSICCDMVRRYRAAGVDCVIDAFAPPAEYEAWRAELPDGSVRVVVLLPALEAVLARNAQRQGADRLADESIKENYSWVTAWRQMPFARLVDSTEMDAAAAAQAVEQSLRG